MCEIVLCFDVEISTRPFQLVTGRVWKGTAFGGTYILVVYTPEHIIIIICVVYSIIEKGIRWQK